MGYYAEVIALAHANITDKALKDQDSNNNVLTSLALLVQTPRTARTVRLEREYGTTSRGIVQI